MPDWNPDREGHIKHKWVVQKAWPDPNSDLGAGVQTSRGELKPDAQGRMIVNDPALAHEIRTEHPRDMTVTRMRFESPADRGHRYHFGCWPEMPWKKKEREQQPEGQLPQAEKPEEEQPPLDEQGSIENAAA